MLRTISRSARRAAAPQALGPLASYLASDDCDVLFLVYLKKFARRIPFKNDRVALEATFLLVSILPLSGLAVDLPTARFAFGLIWLPVFILLCYLQMTCSWHMWLRVKGCAPSIDQLVQNVPEDVQRRLALDLRRWTSSWWLIAAMIAFTAAACTVVAIEPEDYFGKNGLSFTALFMIMMVGFISGYGGYITFMGWRVVRQILRLPNLKCSWPVPFNTEALLLISRTASRTAAWGVLIFLVAQIPLTYHFVRHRTIPITVLYVASFLLMIGLITLVGLTVPVMLSNIVLRAKDDALAQIARQIEFSNNAHKSRLSLRRKYSAQYLERLERHVSIYRAVNDAPGSFVSSATVTQYIASLAAVLLQFIIPVLVK